MSFSRHEARPAETVNLSLSAGLSCRLSGSSSRSGSWLSFPRGAARQGDLRIQVVIGPAFLCECTLPPQIPVDLGHG